MPKQVYNAAASGASSPRHFLLWLLQIQNKFYESATSKTPFAINIGQHCATFGNLLDSQHMARHLINDQRVQKFTGFIERLVDEASKKYGAKTIAPGSVASYIGQQGYKYTASPVASNPTATYNPYNPPMY